MTITTLLSGLPARTMDQTTFDQAQAKLMTDLPTWGAQVNAMGAGMNAIAAGGAYAIPYIFDSTITDADPTAGKLRLSSATQNASTVLRADLFGTDLADWTTVLDTFDASTSGVKGSIRLVKQGDATKWLTFDVTARAAPTGYRNISVTNTGGSSASPFTTGDGIMLFFQRNGDMGTLSGAQVFLGSATVGSAVANIDFLTSFTSTYDKYTIEIEAVKPSASDTLSIRLAKAGAVDGANVYYSPLVSGSTLTLVAQAALAPVANIGNPVVLTVEIRNVNDAVNTIKGIGVRGMYFNSTPAAVSIAAEGGYSSANTATGFRLLWTGGANFTGGTIRVYGQKNT